MKKLLFCLVIAAMAAGSAFADFTAANWTWSDYSTDYITDVAPSGFDVDTTGAESFAEFYFYTDDISGWLFDPNEPVTVTVTGFENSDTNNTMLGLYVNDDDYLWAAYEVPWEGAGTYTFTADNRVIMDRQLAGSDITYIELWVYNADRDYLYVVPGETGSVRLTLGIPEEEPEEEDLVVPEPAAYAYGALGFVSVIGMKRRIRK